MKRTKTIKIGTGAHNNETERDKDEHQNVTAEQRGARAERKNEEGRESFCRGA